MKLKELQDNISQIKGIGKNKKLVFNKLSIFSIYDLLTFFPRKYEDRVNILNLQNAVRSDAATIIATVIKQEYIDTTSFKILKITIQDDENEIAELLCFNRNFLANILTLNNKYFFYGTFKFSKTGIIQCSNFDFEYYSDTPKNFYKIKPIYNLTEGLTSDFIAKTVLEASSIYLNYIEEDLPEELIKVYNLQSIKIAIKEIHLPTDFDLLEQAKKSLKFVELYNLNKSIILKKIARQTSYKKPFIKIFDHQFSSLQNKIIESLSFKLTDSQKKVILEIIKDIYSQTPMERVLQGDVGCGKTIVAFLSAAIIFEQGKQVAIMEPTELLAKQVAEKAFNLLSKFNIRVALLTGSINCDSKKRVLDKLKKGEIDLIIGTHSLFSADVQYKNLSLIIIDEQHKFGVNQRKQLKEKGIYPDILLMSATPIPQTLALTLYGDLDISTIDTMPSNRKKIITHLAKMSNQNKVYDYIKNELRKKNQVYFIYPLINENDSIELKSAYVMAEKLSTEIFPQARVALLHSKVDDNNKDEIMKHFLNGEIDIIVATTVLEVGIDNPNATAIVIEHAERFGLATLHQLRGRVGRGEKQSYCFLIYSDEISSDAKKRMRIMLNTLDGFLIAEEDLKNRGPGELAGEKQSGFLKLKIANIIEDKELMNITKYEASKSLNL